MTIWLMCWGERVTNNGELTTVFHAEGRLETSRPLISLNDSLEVFISGIKNLVNALLILILTWTVGDSFTKCTVGQTLSSLLAHLGYRLLPLFSSDLLTLVFFACSLCLFLLF
jgi:Na+/H+ antiporter NhaC